MRMTFCSAVSTRAAAALMFAGSLISGSAAVSFTVTPNTISNTYTGAITYQITGLTNGETVIVQKFVDANGNGVIDDIDTLWQQFKLTDGKATVFYDGATPVTNLIVPGDLDPTPGQITSVLSFPVMGFEQSIIANYLIKVSSPVGNFAPLTNTFTVTNFAWGQTLSGNVTANGTNVPYATVMLFAPSGNNLSPQGGILANGAGAYSVSAAPGSYLLLPFHPGFVGNVGTAPQITLSSGTNISTNLTLTLADRYIAGSVVDASNSLIGLAGMMIPVESSSGLITITSTDTNGAFAAAVTSDVWKLEGSDEAIAMRGYVRPQNKLHVDTTGGSVSNATVSVVKATAMFYGTVLNAQSQPMPDISLYSSDNSNSYEQNATSDANGNYFAAALSGSLWQAGLSSDGNPTNYAFSQPSIFSNGGTNLSTGQALRVNFTAIVATNSLTGHIQSNTGTPLGNLAVFASATINGTTYHVNATTDSNGNYAVNVANGVWYVGVSCQGGNNSLDSILGPGNYQCPNNQAVTINNNSGSANFTIQPCGGIQMISPLPLPNGVVGITYNYQFFAQTCSGDVNFTWSLNSGTPPPGVTLYSGGSLFGTPTTNGTFNFSVHCSNGSVSTNQNFSVIVYTQPAIVSPVRPSNSQFQMLVNGSSGVNYTIQMSTNLSSTNWVALLTTNPATAPFTFTDPNATNRTRFYRVLLVP